MDSESTFSSAIPDSTGISFYFDQQVGNFQQGMARSQVPDGGERHQIWKCGT